jgi:hypothetical protein
MGNVPCKYLWMKLYMVHKNYVFNESEFNCINFFVSFTVVLVIGLI